MDVRTLMASSISRWIGLLLISAGFTWLGIAARGTESLSLFFPATAALFGLLVRFPALGRLKYWPAMYLGMVLTDLLNNSPLHATLWFNACNVLQIVCGLMMVSLRDLNGLREPKAVLYLFLVATLTVAIGATAAMPFSIDWFQNSPQSAWLAWFSEQLATTMLLAPAMICLPKNFIWRWPKWSSPVPLLSVLLLCVIGQYVGGPGAIAFVLPALLWCAMRYSLFGLACLVLVVGTAEIMLLSSTLGMSNEFSLTDPLCSARLGIAMLVVSPLLVAAAMQANQRLMAQIEHRANHDFLTGALTRRAFTQQAKRIFEKRRQQPHCLAVMLMDIDHFKKINDTYGHAAGDEALRGFSRLVSEQLRSVEIFGRLGGEEFALLLEDVSHTQALDVGERLRHSAEEHEFKLPGGLKIKFTVSIGIAYLDQDSSHVPFELLLERADIALYQAKAQGRNQVLSSVTKPMLPEKLKLSMY